MQHIDQIQIVGIQDATCHLGLNLLQVSVQRQSENCLTAVLCPAHRPTDRHLSARYTVNQTHSQPLAARPPKPLAARPPNQPVDLSYPSHGGGEHTRPRGHHPDNRVSIDGELVSLMSSRLDPGMCDQAPKSWSLPIIEEFKMVKYNREKFFVPGKVNGRCSLSEPSCTDHVRFF